MESFCGLKNGAIKGITAGKDSKKSSEKNPTNILVGLL